MSESTAAVREAIGTPTLTKRDLHRSFWRYILSFQISWNYERMQALGFCWAMVPVLRRLFPDNAEFSAGLQRHLVFFNTSPIVGGPLILGSTVAMEEAGSATSAEGVKVAMMGPMAGIGDTLTFALYNSIIFTLGASYALQGKIFGPIMVAVLVLIPYLLVRRWQFTLGYTQGKNLVTRLATGALERLNEGATVLGLIVLGGFIPSIVKVVTTITYKQGITTTTNTGATQRVTQQVHVQDQLDTILPFMLPVAVTALVYVMLRKFNLNPIWAIAALFAIGLALGWAGWFAPALPEAK